MTTEAFKALGAAAQRKFLLEQGSYLGHRKATPWSVLLYQVQDYYVEVYFSMNNLDIQKIEAFSDLDRLEPYLERISIDGLLTT
jgi:hypothetical protein